MFFVKDKKKIIKTGFLLAGLCLCILGARGVFEGSTVAASANGGGKAYLAIVIDDFGYNGEGTNEMLSLPIPLTAAVMPFSDHTAEDSEAVHAAGKELIVHMPMESLTGKKSWVGDKGVFTNMTDEEIKGRVQEALENTKYAVGLNNHMGSAVMENERCLGAVMDVVSEKGLIFVDSKTTPKSVGDKICRLRQVEVIDRDVFLDSTDDIAQVKKRLRQAGEIALAKGSALAIGHVGPEGGKITAQAIRELAPELEKQGIEFVTVTQMGEMLKNTVNTGEKQ